MHNIYIRSSVIYSSEKSRNITEGDMKGQDRLRNTHKSH